MSRFLRTLFGIATASLVFLAGVAVGQNQYGQPKTVLHVVALKWKADATDEQKQKAIDGIKEMAATIPGIKNIWLKTDRVQPREYSAAFAIEFENRAAADAYAEHPAHEAWYEIYIPIREESRSLQVTNP
ncbi:MAG TPA: Dabb family protein [Candidatus Acidoferrales bacterium]|nr:Dabb family protein [Candidatus Acidoferrales bacterium]